MKLSLKNKQRRLCHDAGKIGLKFLLLITGVGIYFPLSATTHHVGNGRMYGSLTQALSVTVPGDTVMIHEGTYPGGLSIPDLQGTATKWIYIITAFRIYPLVQEFFLLAKFETSYGIARRFRPYRSADSAPGWAEFQP